MSENREQEKENKFREEENDKIKGKMMNRCLKRQIINNVNMNLLNGQNETD